MNTETEQDITEPNLAAIEAPTEPGLGAPRVEEPLELDLLEEFEEGAPCEQDRVFKTIILASSRVAGAGPAAF